MWSERGPQFYEIYWVRLLFVYPENVGGVGFCRSVDCGPDVVVYEILPPDEERDLLGLQLCLRRAPDALMRVFEFALILAPEQEFDFRFFAEKVNLYEDFAESIDLAYLHLDRTCRILDFALIVRRSFNEKV